MFGCIAGPAAHFLPPEATGKACLQRSAVRPRLWKIKLAPLVDSHKSGHAGASLLDFPRWSDPIGLWLTTNFKAARLEDGAATAMLRSLEADIEAIRFDAGGGGRAGRTRRIPSWLSWARTKRPMPVSGL
jgi:hypothetical protein